VARRQLWRSNRLSPTPLQNIFSFYSLCGGGDFGPMIRFLAIEAIAQETSRWISSLREYDARGDVLFPGRHVVFANDADGTPFIWDARSGEVASFYWKGGDWEEPRFPSHDAFMEHIFASYAEVPEWERVLDAVGVGGGGQSER
jgi:hypothetical protein